MCEGCESRNNHRYAVVVQDLASQWIQSYPCKTKTSQETERSFLKFWEPRRKLEIIHTDNSLEFGKACEDLSWNHCTSTPHRSETNGIVERAVRRVKEGTSAVLLQWGLDEKWSADSMECYTYLRNIQDLLSEEKTPCERRFGEPFKKPIIPLGSLVEYHPITAKDQSRIHQFVKKVLPGLFLGYALYASICKESLTWIVRRIRIVRGWNLEGWHTGCRPWRVGNDGRIRNVVIFPKEEGEFIFPAADGRIKLPGGDQELRTSTLVRHHPSRGEGQRDFLGESEGSPPPSPQDSLPDAGEARNDFLVHSRKLHIPPSRWTKSRTLLAKRRIIPCSAEVHWCVQNFVDKIGSYTRKPHRWLLEYRWIKRFVWFLDRFHSVYSIKWETSRWIHMVRVTTDKTAVNIQARSFMVRTVEKNAREREAEGEA